MVLGVPEGSVRENSGLEGTDKALKFSKPGILKAFPPSFVMTVFTASVTNRRHWCPTGVRVSDSQYNVLRTVPLESYCFEPPLNLIGLLLERSISTMIPAFQSHLSETSGSLPRPVFTSLADAFLKIQMCQKDAKVPTRTRVNIFRACCPGV